MRSLKEVLEIIKSVPVLGIGRAVLSGRFGCSVPLAVVAQILLQGYCAVILSFGVLGTAMVTAALLIVHLVTGLLLCMAPFTGMWPKPLYKGAAGFLGLAVYIALVFPSIGATAAIGLLGIALSGSVESVFLLSFGLSVLGGAVIHLVGVGLPIYLAERKRERGSQSS